MSCFYLSPSLILVVPLTRMPVVVGKKTKYVLFMKANEDLLNVSKTQAFETLTIIRPNYIPKIIYDILHIICEKSFVQQNVTNVFQSQKCLTVQFTLSAVVSAC